LILTRERSCYETLAGRQRSLFPRWAVTILVVAYTTEAALLMLVQLYLKDVGSSSLLIGLNTSLASLGLLLGSWVWGEASDRIRPGLLVAGLLVAISVLCGALALRLPPWWALIAVGSFYLAIGGLVPIFLNLASSSTGPSGRGKLLSAVAASRSSGWVIGGVLAGVLLQYLGFSIGLGAFAILPLLALPIAGVLASRFPSRPPSPRQEERNVKSSGVPLWWLYLSVVFRQMGISGSMALIFVYMSGQGIPASLMGVLSAINPMMQVVALPLFGALTDWLGRRPFLVMGFALSSAIPMILALTSGEVGIAGGFLLLGVSYASVYVGTAAFIGDRSAVGRHGRMLGRFEASIGLGGVLGPIVAGSLLPVLGFQRMFLSMAGASALGLLLVFVKTRANRVKSDNGQQEGKGACSDRTKATEGCSGHASDTVQRRRDRRRAVVSCKR